ncbi:MAG: two-component system response regulator [Myxococcales bacterium]|mgnify:CR=1 FL=1|nr:two-component system response regulator [Myxococcales bacterium]|tara:strand:+ start:528 stop:977 length:450 start_codon:yes stop_codon:yes gene_type:complete
MTAQGPAPIKILLAEDNGNDVEIFRICMGQARILNTINVVNDGDEALRYLRGEGDFADRDAYPLPGLIFLDINLPGPTGLDILREIRDDANLADIPVVILTISQAEDDILQSYQYGSNVYVHKPIDPVNLREVILGLPGIGVMLTAAGE